MASSYKLKIIDDKLYSYIQGIFNQQFSSKKRLGNRKCTAVEQECGMTKGIAACCSGLTCNCIFNNICTCKDLTRQQEKPVQPMNPFFCDRIIRGSDGNT